MVHAVVPERVECSECCTGIIINVPRLEQEVGVEGANGDAALREVELNAMVADQCSRV